MTTSIKNKTYFLSDIHLGAPYIEDHRVHEMRVVRFLDQIKEEAKAIYFVGDIFDFWAEYRQAIPKGFTRFLGKIAELSDAGIKIHFFGGNHDMWMYDYFPTELGVEVHLGKQIIELENKRFYIAHGEDLGITDKAFMMLLKVFRSKLFQWTLRTFVHPDFIIKLAKIWSNKSRHKNGQKETTKYLGEEKEHLIRFAKNYKGDKPIDFFIFGHRHIVLDLMIKKDSRVVILGDWISHFSYAEYHDSNLLLTECEQ